MKMNNKVVWITGASSGIGAALAGEYSKLGTRLILSSRNLESLETVRSQCRFPDKIRILEMDLEQYEILSESVDKAVGFFGKIDVLINNAGISQRSFAADTDLAVDKKIIDINYFGTISLTKGLIPHFREQNGGHFVVVTSVVGKIGTPLRSSYSASKHALHGFFDSLRAELFEDNIKVTLICPGYVRTNVSINAVTGSGKKQGTMDHATENGLDPNEFAKKAIRAIRNERQELVIGGLKERLAVWVKRFFPLILSRMIRKIKVT
ncbi:SDR family oxidoreductase [Lutimonas saemankumensis]|uniref:SDR family oxidoreductase n=1 Tax=Lutimonas saemankumensis TaxID=483016 RepID=UPI001CD3B607|nr:SDR family oxidoreductase [Lutimonas saemankumensis]MCA0933146.1 SDR family oxidoreductase [Lutimonas saemankumensis]